MLRSSKKVQWIIAFLSGAVGVLLWINHGLQSRNNHRNALRREVLNFEMFGTYSKALFGEEERLSSGDGNDTKPISYLDEPTDMHLHYEYIRNPIGNCIDEFPEPMRDDVFLIFLVFSSPERYKWRQAIRETYGQRRAWERWSGVAAGVDLVNETTTTPARTVFLLGTPSDARFQAHVDAEFDQYRDIVQEDFVDHPENATLKLVMGLKWVTKFCLNARYVMTIDDGTMMNQRKLLDKLKDAPNRAFASGTALAAYPVERRRGHRYSLPTEYYPPKTFPPFIRRSAVLSLDAAVGAYRVALTTPLFPIADVFLGMCLQTIGVELTSFDRHILGHLPERYTERQKVRKARGYTLISSLSPKEMRWMWEIGRGIN